MEPRGNTTRWKHAAAPLIRTSEPAGAVWRLLAGKDDEDFTLQISVLTFCKTKGDRDMKKTLLAFSLLIMAGCSTEPVLPQYAKEVPIPKEFQQKTNTTAVTIIRDKGFVAGGCAITTYINGKYLAELDTGEKVTAFLNPGDVLVGAGFAGKGLCNGAPKKEREFSIKENDPRALRIFIDQSGNVDILPMSIN